MQNVKWEVKDDKLIVEIDLTKDFGPSKSGKTITVASSLTWQPENRGH